MILLSFPFSLSLVMQKEPLEDLGLMRKRLKGGQKKGKRRGKNFAPEGKITGPHKALSSSIFLDGSLSLV